MTWDLATAKARLGLTDTTQDPAVQSALDVALAIVETYCDRRFLKQDDTEEFMLPCGPSLLVRRYPLVALGTLAPLDPVADPVPDPLPVPTTWRMDKRRGIIFMVGAPPWVAFAPAGSTPPANAFYGGARAGFVLSYTGGYDTLPADLEAGMFVVFDAVWYGTPGWGAAAGSQSDAGADAVKSFAIDGMTLGFDTGGTDKAASRASGDVGSWGPMLPLGATTLLQGYRAETVMGVG
jgi:hypothetical protein